MSENMNRLIEEWFATKEDIQIKKSELRVIAEDIAAEALPLLIDNETTFLVFDSGDGRYFLLDFRHEHGDYFLNRITKPKFYPLE